MKTIKVFSRQIWNKNQSTGPMRMKMSALELPAQDTSFQIHHCVVIWYMNEASSCYFLLTCLCCKNMSFRSWRSHLLLCFFSNKEYFIGKQQLVQDLIMDLPLCIYTCVLCTHTNMCMPRSSLSGITGPSMCLFPTPWAHIKYPMYGVWSAHTRTPKKGGSNLLFDIHLWDLNYARPEMPVAVPTLLNPCRIGHCSTVLRAMRAKKWVLFNFKNSLDMLGSNSRNKKCEEGGSDCILLNKIYE